MPRALTFVGAQCHATKILINNVILPTAGQTVEANSTIHSSIKQLCGSEMAVPRNQE